MVGALASSMVLNAQKLHELMRCCVISMLLHRYVILPGFRVDFFKRVTKKRGAFKQWCHEKVQGLIRQSADARDTMGLDWLHTKYGRHAQIFRFACEGGPGPRYAWPGLNKAEEGKHRSNFDDTVRELETRFMKLHALANEVLRVYAHNHPILRHTRYTSLLDHIFQRIRSTTSYLLTLFNESSETIRKDLNSHHLSFLCKLAFPEDAPSVVTNGQPMPETLLVGLTQTSEDIYFLKKMVALSRACLLRFVSIDKPWVVPPTPEIHPNGDAFDTQGYFRS